MKQNNSAAEKITVESRVTTKTPHGLRTVSQTANTQGGAIFEKWWVRRRVVQRFVERCHPDKAAV